jgi:hypothetical protein
MSRRLRAIGYWLPTVIVAWEMIAGSMWDLLRIEFVRTIFAHLGYPLYLLTILGIWKLPCALVLLLPRFPRLKEWAYAGAFFTYSGAAASHALVGDGGKNWAGPLVFALLTLASWALRPADRRLPQPTEMAPVRPVSWIIAVAVAGRDAGRVAAHPAARAGALLKSRRWRRRGCRSPPRRRCRRTP